MSDTLAVAMAKTRRQALRPPPRMCLPQWADTYRRLSAAVGAIGGAWRTSRVEIARGPMMAPTEKGVRVITVESCTQLMKTSLLENIIGFHTHLDPCPMLLTQPKDQAVKIFSKERIAPMARATPVLQKLLGGDRMRGGDDTLQYKEFPGGFLAMESAGSPTNLAMRPIRITLADEIDKYETTKEGDPVSLLEERTSTYDNTTGSLHVRACSPTIEEVSRIDKSYYEGDQRRAFVACPHCQHEQTLDFFRHVQWNKSDEGEHFPTTAAIFCEVCGTEWTESQRLAIMTKAFALDWRQTRPFTCCGIKQEPLKTRQWVFELQGPATDDKGKAVDRFRMGYACCSRCGVRTVPNTHASFHASKLYSPFITIPELAKKWIDSKDDPETKQTFYNTQLGLAFKSQILKHVDANALNNRREQYPAAVPAGVLVLTAGCDVQPGSTVSEGRIECEVVGWGRGEESWSITHRVFRGDPGKPGIWAELDAFLLSSFAHESGYQMAIRGVCIDSGGHNTEAVYQFARARIVRNVWAIKGAADRGGQWSPVWPIPKFESRRTKAKGYRPIIIGVNAAKESVRQRLLIQDQGPGYSHFPDTTPDGTFDQLTAEEMVKETKNGFDFRRWTLKRGRANEALDCRVYAYAALCGLYAVRKLNLERVADMIETIRPNEPGEALPVAREKPPAAPPAALPAAPPAPVRRLPRRSNFVG